MAYMYHDTTVLKAMVSDKPFNEVTEKQNCYITSEPLKNYISEFRKELHLEISEISKIKWK